MRKLQLVFLLLLIANAVLAQTKRAVVAGRVTRQPLPNASVLDSKGRFLGVGNDKGELPPISKSDCPVTVKYLGYEDLVLYNIGKDTLFMDELAMKLPEIVIQPKKHTHLHLLAYVREYSTLSTLTDTVTLFREKMVDFLTPLSSKNKIKGWHTPRVLTARSFYRFTDSAGLDSVSDRCSHHFSWTDWVGMPPVSHLPSELVDKENGSFTLSGKYSVTELWNKNDDRVSVEIDVLADTTSRKWVANLQSFFHKDTDFESFKIHYNFEPVMDNLVSDVNLKGYSFNIESKGRGRGMFMFNRRDEPFYVSTYCEVYIIDKEYIEAAEAKKWSQLHEKGCDIALLVPVEAPPLQASVQSLISRVNNLDHNSVRLATRPDISSIGYRAEPVSIGKSVLQRLKSMVGIDHLIANRKWNKSYNEFRKGRQSRPRK